MFGKSRAILIAVAMAVTGIIIVRLTLAATDTVTTSTGVVTHGTITTTDDTIGWLLTCQPSHTLNDDPIVYPGQPGAAHTHDFWGNASTNANSTVATQEAPANNAVKDVYSDGQVHAGTSCDLGQYDPGTAGDTASYWAPAVFANGTRVVPGTKAQLYYRSKPTFGTDFKTIPQDARIIVGNSKATSLADNADLSNGNIWWECIGTSDESHHNSFPTTCADVLLNLRFPSCYDGGPMDHTGPNHTDNQHFAYAVNGTCPATHTIKIPQLSEKFKYNLPDTGMNVKLTSMLMPDYTVHADFWNTWNPGALQFLVDKCINAQISCGTNPITPLSIISPAPSVIFTPVPPVTPTPTDTPATRPGDLNGDGHINVTDLSLLLSKWGTATAATDVNHDGTVGVIDLSLLLSNWTG